ncbi:MAG: phosphotransferase [Bacteriovoracaceae bacterium]
MSTSLESTLQEILKPFGSLQRVEVIQKLWSGYGSLCRVSLSESDKTLITKLIQFPEGEESFSHLRKIKSYEVEMAWYHFYNNKIFNSYIPECLARGSYKDSHYLVLEDLQEKGFKVKTEVSLKDVELCLKWLAYFHGYYLGTASRKLWEVGTYWHLETRPKELSVLTDIELKESAAIINERLNSSQFKTIVHGDAKLANFLFKKEAVAAVDFQYVGGGVGIKDVAYFLSSLYTENELQENEKKCLDYYFSELKKAIIFYEKKIDFNLLENEYRELYPYAWCDFYRFLKGWSPGHWKIHSYSENMKKRVLDEIN